MSVRMVVEYRNTRRILDSRKKKRAVEHLEAFIQMSPAERLAHLEEHRECPEWRS